MNTSKEKLQFSNEEQNKPENRHGLSFGIITTTDLGKVESVVFSIHPKVVDQIGAELFVHEFNEVAIYEVVRRIETKDGLKPKEEGDKGRTGIIHNLNAESDDEYIEERNLAKGYIPSDRLPIIDREITVEETNKFYNMVYTSQERWQLRSFEIVKAKILGQK